MKLSLYYLLNPLWMTEQNNIFDNICNLFDNKLSDSVHDIDIQVTSTYLLWPRGGFRRFQKFHNIHLAVLHGSIEIMSKGESF